MIAEALNKVIANIDLSETDAHSVMEEIMEGRVTNSQMGAFLAAMRMKGETISEITAFSSVMREKCQKLNPPYDVLDIVGTGGDKANTFNISTVSSIVVASGGVKVAKHGNRSVSSKCGAADVLEALGVKIDLGAEESQKVLDKIGICFLFSQVYHLSMRYAAPVRKEMGIRTIFNILGPLANPAGANMQLLGVYDENLVEPLARVLKNLGLKRAMVVHGHDGLDEISMCDSTTVCEVSENGMINSFFLSPKQFGLELCGRGDLTGGIPEENAQIALRILNGEKGPKRNAVIMNSAVALYMANSNKTLRECIKIAGELIDSGKAMKKLEQFKAVTNEY